MRIQGKYGEGVKHYGDKHKKEMAEERKNEKRKKGMMGNK